MAGKVKWQSHGYTMPEKGYGVFLRVEDVTEEPPLAIFQPLRQLMTDEAEVYAAVEAYLGLVVSKREELNARRNPLLLEMKLSTLIPLNKHMWGGTSRQYDASRRTVDFMRMLPFYEFYRVLVLPTMKEGAEETLELAMPVLTTTRAAQMAKMMDMIGYPVDAEATHAALYEPVRLCGFDMNLREMVGDDTEKI